MMRKGNRVLKSPNMYYAYYHEYMEYYIMNKGGDKGGDSTENNVSEFDFKTALKKSPLNNWRQIPNYQSFKLKTIYPGLTMGLSYPHLNEQESVKTGFSFDYVTGLPFLPGSSLKGMLRSYFPKSDSDAEIDKGKREYIKSLTKDSIDEIVNEIFENGEITFLGAYPSKEENKKNKLIDTDYITPHNKDVTKNPNPIKILKVRPEITFEFGFISHNKDYEKIIFEVFESIVKDMGIGSKTNVGFGRMIEVEKEEKKSGNRR